MKIVNFKPKLIPTLFTISALIFLLSLSIWQFKRMYWKQEIIDKVALQSQMAEIALPDHVDLPAMQYRKVNLKGEFLHDHEMHLYGGARQFKGEIGYYILTPIKLEDNRIIIINRGWVPEKLKDPSKRPETLIIGEQDVSGFVMQNEQKTLYIHDNQPQRNLWFYINLAEISSFLKLSIENYYILAKDDPNNLLRSNNLNLNFHNRHLGYALTWLFSAVALIVIYILYTISHPRE